MKTNISFCDIVEHELVSIELPRVGVNALNNVKQLCGLPQGGQFADEVSQQSKDKKESLREKEFGIMLKKCDTALQVEHQPLQRLCEEFKEMVENDTNKESMNGLQKSVQQCDAIIMFKRMVLYAARAANKKLTRGCYEGSRRSY